MTQLYENWLPDSLTKEEAKTTNCKDGTKLFELTDTIQKHNKCKNDEQIL